MSTLVANFSTCLHQLAIACHIDLWDHETLSSCLSVGLEKLESCGRLKLIHTVKGEFLESEMIGGFWIRTSLEKEKERVTGVDLRRCWSPALSAEIMHNRHCQIYYVRKLYVTLLTWY